MNAIAAVAALSVAALTLFGLLRAGVGGRLVADPSGERWHTRSTPLFGGVGIFLGLAAGSSPKKSGSRNASIAGVTGLPQWTRATSRGWSLTPGIFSSD